MAMSAGQVAAIVATVLFYNAIYALPFMAATPTLSYPRACQLNQSAFAISNGIPAGGASGLGVQYAMLASYAIAPSATTAAMGAVGVRSVFITLGLPVLGLLAISGSATIDAGRYLYVGVVGLTALGIMVGGSALLMRSELVAHRLGTWADRLLGALVDRFGKGRTVEFVPVVVTFRAGIVDLVRRRWAAITLAQLGVSLAQFLILYVAPHAVADAVNRDATSRMRP